MKNYIGFDTSNYTTSIGVVSGKEIFNIRQILPVAENERGLRQSNALFLHIKQIPELFKRLSESFNVKTINSIGVSTKPRNVQGSYMPVFLAGESFAKMVSISLGVPIFEYSHQDGHIMAGIKSSNSEKLLEKDFLSVHLSGGTSEILKSRFCGSRFNSKIIGATLDISAGQVIDRVGVMMGLRFPCGKELEKLVSDDTSDIPLPLSEKDGYFNFSGLETKIEQIKDKYSNEVLAKSVFISIAKTLALSLNRLSKKYYVNDILIVGGVASNTIIKEYLISNVDANICFASKEYSTDNAVGIAYLEKYRNGEI